MMSVFFNKPLLQSIRRIDPDAYSLAAIGKYRGIPDWVRAEAQPQLTLCVADEAPMESDLELTPSPSVEPVDISTDGYAEWGLNWDLMELVGEKVVEIRNKINQDWYCARVQFVPFTEKYWSSRRDRELTTSFYREERGTGQVAIKASGCLTECGNNQSSYTWRIRNDLHSLTRHLEHKGRAFKPSNLRFKYAKKQMCGADFTWRHSLAERRELLRERNDRLYGAPKPAKVQWACSHRGVRYERLWEWDGVGCW